ncbi:MAG: STAS domain-containing protein [Kangiellaceae bacterium]|jgi:anti-anti-sigma regulatory factor|nr:STAS domain-containing protein [Kangiellaceae bacterium]
MTTKIQYGQTNGSHVFKMSGDIRYGDIIALQQYLEHFDLNNLTVLVDLSEASHLDSTALGVLAILAIKCREDGEQKPTIYVDNPVVIEALMGVCFDLIFNIENQFESPDVYLEDIASASGTLADVSGTVTVAHKALSEISDSNQELFKDVNKLLKKL